MNVIAAIRDRFGHFTGGSAGRAGTPGPGRTDDAGDLVAERLERLASGLTPDADHLRGLEEPLLAAYRATLSSPQVRAVGAGSAWAGIPLRRGARRSLALGLTGALLLASVSLAATQTDPGEPLYGLRLDLEAAGRPADPDGRVAWDRQALAARAAELAGASRAGDAGAARAAGDAYAAAVARTVESAAATETLATLPGTLGVQLSVLQGLLATTPDAAHDGLNRAILAVLAARERAAERREAAPGTGQPSTPPGGPAGPAGSRGPAGSAGSGGDAEPSGTTGPGRPAASADPTASPGPHDGTAPAVTPRPRPTPPPAAGGQSAGPTARPGGPTTRPGGPTTRPAGQPGVVPSPKAGGPGGGTGPSGGKNAGTPSPKPGGPGPGSSGGVRPAGGRASPGAGGPRGDSRP